MPLQQLPHVCIIESRVTQIAQDIDTDLLDLHAAVYFNLLALQLFLQLLITTIRGDQHEGQHETQRAQYERRYIFPLLQHGAMFTKFTVRRQDKIFS